MCALTAVSVRAQLASLEGELLGRGIMGRSTSLTSGSVSTNSDFSGILRLSGSAFAFDPSIAAFAFRCSLREGLISSSSGDNVNSSNDRTLDWYSVDGKLFAKSPVVVSVASSLSETNLTSSASIAGVPPTFGAFRSLTQQHRAGLQADLGRFGWLSTGATAGATTLAGFQGDTTVRTRQFDIQYGQTGERGEDLNARFAYWDNAAASAVRIRTTETTVLFGKRLAGGVLTANATHRVDAFGRDTRLNISSQREIDTLFQTITGVDASLFAIGRYTRAMGSVRHGYTLVTQSGYSGTCIGSGGLTAAYTPIFPADQQRGVAAVGGLTTSGNYHTALDAAGTTTLNVGAGAAANYDGRLAGVPINTNLNGYVDKKLGATVLSGTLGASKTFGMGPSAALSEGAHASTTLLGLAMSATLNHTSRFVRGPDSLGAPTVILEDFSMSLTINGSLSGSTATISLLAAEGWEHWIVQRSTIQCSVSYPGIVRGLDGTMTYDLNYSSGLLTHRVFARLMLQFRAVNVSAQYVYTRWADLSRSDVYLTLSRPFSLL